MLYREIIAVCSQINTKRINALCGQNVEVFKVKSGGAKSNHWPLTTLICVQISTGSSRLTKLTDSLKSARHLKICKSNARIPLI
jgi:hypothetical protein